LPRSLEAAQAHSCTTQDFLASLVLSECAYKKFEVDSGAQLAARVSELLAWFPAGWVQLQGLQVTLMDRSLPHQ
jgi:hypothetical protein